MSDELVEKVAQAMLDNAQRRAVNGGMDIYLVLNDWHREDARTAIALIRAETLEEAARVAETVGATAPEANIWRGAYRSAAAIRALEDRT